jgi:hypothetical protein
MNGEGSGPSGLTCRLLDRRFIVLGLELVVILGVAVLVCNFIGQRFRIAPPVLLLVSGTLLGFLPIGPQCAIAA